MAAVKSWYHLFLYIDPERNSNHTYFTLFLNGQRTYMGDFGSGNVTADRLRSNSYIGKSNWSTDPGSNMVIKSFNIIYSRFTDPSQLMLPHFLYYKGPNYNLFTGTTIIPNKVGLNLRTHPEIGEGTILDKTDWQTLKNGMSDLYKEIDKRPNIFAYARHKSTGKYRFYINDSTEKYQVISGGNAWSNNDIFRTRVLESHQPKYATTHNDINYYCFRSPEVYNKDITIRAKVNESVQLITKSSIPDPYDGSGWVQQYSTPTLFGIKEGGTDSELENYESEFNGIQEGITSFTGENPNTLEYINYFETTPTNTSFDIQSMLIPKSKPVIDFEYYERTAVLAKKEFTGIGYNKNSVFETPGQLTPSILNKIPDGAEIIIGRYEPNLGGIASLARDETQTNINADSTGSGTGFKLYDPRYPVIQNMGSGYKIGDEIVKNVYFDYYRVKEIDTFQATKSYNSVLDVKNYNTSSSIVNSISAIVPRIWQQGNILELSKDASRLNQMQSIVGLNSNSIKTMSIKSVSIEFANNIISTSDEDPNPNLLSFIDATDDDERLTLYFALYIEGIYFIVTSHGSDLDAGGNVIKEYPLTIEPVSHNHPSGLDNTSGSGIIQTGSRTQPSINFNNFDISGVTDFTITSKNQGYKTGDIIKHSGNYIYIVRADFERSENSLQLIDLRACRSSNSKSINDLQEDTIKHIYNQTGGETNIKDIRLNTFNDNYITGMGIFDLIFNLEVTYEGSGCEIDVSNPHEPIVSVPGNDYYLDQTITKQVVTRIPLGQDSMREIIGYSGQSTGNGLGADGIIDINTGDIDITAKGVNYMVGDIVAFQYNDITSAKIVIVDYQIFSISISKIRIAILFNTNSENYEYIAGLANIQKKEQQTVIKFIAEPYSSSPIFQVAADEINGISLNYSDIRTVSYTHLTLPTKA